MKKILALSLFFSSISFAGEVKQVEELRLKLEDGGYVSILAQPCEIEKAKSLGLTNRAVGREIDGTTHEGCWNSPDISQAEKIEGMRAVPIVNLYFDGVVHTTPLHWYELPPSPDNPEPGETWI